MPENVDVNKDNETCEETEEELISPDSNTRRDKRKDVPGGSGATSQPSKTNKEPATRSPVWNHFTRLRDNKDKCKCHHCQRIFGCASTPGTSNLKKHLYHSCKQFKAWQQRQSQHIIKGDRKHETWKVSEEVFREASNEILVLVELPLAFIEGLAWRYFCSKVKLFTPHSRRTATRDIVEMYARGKAALKKWIAGNKQRVSLTTDIWVANVTRASYMVITLHFVDSNWDLKKLIIGFKYVTDHKGTTISSVLLECLAEWGIEKIFTITVDNATSNTNAVDKFHKQFKLVNKNNDALVMDGEFMHLRCCAHYKSDCQGWFGRR